jgi:hypothetical protein
VLRLPHRPAPLQGKEVTSWKRHRVNRNNAIWAGIFFIIATAFLFVGEAFYGPVLSDPDVLTVAAGAENDVALGVLIEFACVLAIPLIAVALYPVLRRVSAALAIGYVAFRLFEAAVFFQMEVDKLQVLAISREFAASPTTSTDQIDLLIRSLTGGEAWSGTSGSLYNIVFVTGMLMLNWMLWKSRLVPRLIAGWGMVSAVVLGGLAIVVLFLGVSNTLAVALIVPLAVQEMVLALWFIIKGFDGAALDRLDYVAGGETASPNADARALVTSGMAQQ